MPAYLLACALTYLLTYLDAQADTLLTPDPSLGEALAADWPVATCHLWQVEHVRRLNERGNRLLLQSDPSDADLVQAERLFGWALLLNPDCSLCHLNRADAQIQRGDAPAAEGSLRRPKRRPKGPTGRVRCGPSLRTKSR